jgi:hypothetical protein
MTTNANRTDFLRVGYFGLLARPLFSTRRRTLLLCGACAALDGAVARSKPVETLSRPLFLHGPVNVINWAGPQPYLELLHRDGARDALLRWERAAVDPGASAEVRNLISHAIVPPVGDGRRWRVELPSLARLSVAGARRPKIGDVIDVLGFRRSPFMGTPTIAAELLLAGGAIHALPPPGAGAWSSPTPFVATIG